MKKFKFIDGDRSNMMVRTAGAFRATQTLICHFPDAATSTLAVFRIQDLGFRKFTIEGVRLLLTGAGSRESEVACFATADEARLALDKIHRCLAPSRWRWVWRSAVVGLVGVLLLGMGSSKPRSSVPVSSYESNYRNRQSSIVMPPVTTQRVPDYMSPAPAINVPGFVPAVPEANAGAAGMPLPTPAIVPNRVLTPAPSASAPVGAAESDDPFGLKLGAMPPR